MAGPGCAGNGGDWAYRIGEIDDSPLSAAGAPHGHPGGLLHQAWPNRRHPTADSGNSQHSEVHRGGPARFLTGSRFRRWLPPLGFPRLGLEDQAQLRNRRNSDQLDPAGPTGPRQPRGNRRGSRAQLEHRHDHRPIAAAAAPVSATAAHARKRNNRSRAVYSLLRYAPRGP